MECFVTIVHGWKPLTIMTKHSILDVAAALDPPPTRLNKMCFWSIKSKVGNTYTKYWLYIGKFTSSHIYTLFALHNICEIKNVSIYETLVSCQLKSCRISDMMNPEPDNIYSTNVEEGQLMRDILVKYASCTTKIMHWNICVSWGTQNLCQSGPG